MGSEGPHFLPHTPTATPDAQRSYYLFVGRVEKHKGLHTVLPLFRGAARQLVVAGAGNAEVELREQSRDLPNVKFVGRIPYADLAPLCAGAKATLIPSLSLETFGLTALESLAQRTPVIAHKIGALPETISQTRGGVLYSDLGDLEQILNRFDSDAAYGGEFGERGHAGLAAYRTQPFLEQYYRVIDEEQRKAR